jgi:hypothetical protein
VRCVWSSAVLLGLLLGGPSLATASDGWRAAPLFGADVRSLAFDPLTPGRVLAGTSSGQVYESLDGGVHWGPAGARVPLPGWVVSRLEFDPYRRGRVWAALWSLWGAAGGVSVSDDGGRTWEGRGDGLPGSQVYTLAVAKDRPDEILAATRHGVWRSRDAGASWEDLTAGWPDIGKVTSLLIDPYDPDVLYAGTWRRAYRSDDRGATWRGIFDGMVLDSEVFSLRAGPLGEGDLWASTCGWVYHGRDRGGRWQRYSNGMAERRTPSFEVLPGGRLLAGTVAGVYSSDDQGAHWKLRSPKVAVDAIAFDPHAPGTVLVGSEGAGIWRSVDGGSSFEHSATGMVSLRVTDVVAAAGGLALSVRNTEGQDGVLDFAGTRLARAAEGELPTVLDLAVSGGTLLAASEHGLWRGADGRWQRLPELGEERVEAVAARDGWIVARTRGEVVSLRGGAVERQPLAGGGRGVALWQGAAWYVDAGRLWRWDGTRVEATDAPGAVTALGVFGRELLVDTPQGRFRATADGEWRRLPVAGARLVSTGDERLPILALGRDGTARLLDAGGREAIALRLPVPARDVSAAVLLGSRLHLATSGYGLLSSNLMWVGDDASGSGAAALAVSSR